MFSDYLRDVTSREGRLVKKQPSKKTTIGNVLWKGAIDSQETSLIFFLSCLLLLSSCDLLLYISAEEDNF